MALEGRGIFEFLCDGCGVEVTLKSNDTCRWHVTRAWTHVLGAVGHTLGLVQAFISRTGDCVHASLCAKWQKNSSTISIVRISGASSRAGAAAYPAAQPLQSSIVQYILPLTGARSRIILQLLFNYIEFLYRTVIPVFNSFFNGTRMKDVSRKH